jgi:hypothetical protein
MAVVTTLTLVLMLAGLAGFNEIVVAVATDAPRS